MLKKSLSILLALCVITSCTISVYAQEDEVEERADPTALPVAAMVEDGIPAKSGILMEQTTGKILYEKNPDMPLPPASITKIMTLLLVMEAVESGKIQLTDMVTASPEACSMGGSQIWLEPGEQMTVDDLLKAVSVSSANDASVALGEFVAGSHGAFVDLMNQKAKQLGMENTFFMNATGLDAQGHISTARDIALMSCALLKYDLIKKYSTIWMDSLRGGKTELVNTNKLVRFYAGATGLKTGTTNGAGSCLSGSAEREALSLVAVTLGSATSDERFSSVRGLLDYGFANYAAIALPSIDDQLSPTKVIGGVEETVEMEYVTPKNVIVRKEDRDKISQKITVTPNVSAPVEKGQNLGKVEIYVGVDKVGEYDLVAKNQVESMEMLKAFIKLISSTIHLN